MNLLDPLDLESQKSMTVSEFKQSLVTRVVKLGDENMRNKSLDILDSDLAYDVLDILVG